MIKVGSDFSGVGAFNQALNRLDIDHEHVFACDMDKYARQSYLENYGEPGYYPENVYDREIPHESLDIYMTSPPCQAFSIAGKRKGEEDKRGILFYNSLEFIRENNPRFFIFENVKGLLSHDKDPKDPKNPIGRTFNKWVQYLGGKSVDGNPVIFPHDRAVPYHIYIKVINATDFNVPQNRERVFIVGIRDDVDNNFTWPKPVRLTKRLKDVLEGDVDEKYFLSDKMVNWLMFHTSKSQESGNGFKFSPKDENTRIANCINSRVFKMGVDDNYIKVPEPVLISDSGKSRTREIRKISPPLRAHDGCGHDNYVLVKSATKCGYETATLDDSINFSVPNSKTRRGRVGKGVAQTLDTACNQGVIIEHRGHLEKEPNIITNGIVPTLRAESHGHQPKVLEGHRIRRLTPRECFRLMDFPEDFKIEVSDTQAYKQAGNSIVVAKLESITKILIDIIKNRR